MTSCMWVDEFREFSKDFHNLVRTFTAGCHDDHVGITLLCDCVLKHCLSASERPRNEACTSLCDRVECVDGTNTGLHDL